MPRADLRLSGDVLDLHAPVKVLAVMCHPGSARDREALLRHPPPKVIVPRGPHSSDAQRNHWAGELWEKFVLHRHVATLAGALVLALAQLSAFGQPGERRTVMPLAGTILTKWQRAVAPEAPNEKSGLLANWGESLIIDAFETYRGASHLWAAVVYGMIQGRPDLHPLAAGRLPSFLAYAEEIARLATSLNWREPGGEMVLEAGTLWMFILPESVAKKAETLPLGRSDEDPSLPGMPQPPGTPT